MIKTYTTRAEAVAVARGWVGTPYVLRGRVKGAGVDCGTLLAEYLIEVGAATKSELDDLGFYSHDWFCHASNERYMLHLMRHAKLVLETVCRMGVNEARPGCLVLFRVAHSKVYNHGAIVTEWPRGVHASADGVQEIDLTAHWLTGYTQMDIFDIFPAEGAE